jgi:hypothetical protein
MKTKKKPKKTKKKLDGRGCRRKGHQFERDVAILLRKVFPEARRQFEYHVRDAKGCDIQGTAPYLFQCKRGKRYASLSAMQEIEICPIEGGVPVLVTKGDGTEPLACLPFSDFLKLLSKSKT